MQKSIGLLFVVSTLFFSCKKESLSEVKNIEINVTMKMNSTYSNNVIHPNDQDEDDIVHITKDTQHNAMTKLTISADQKSSLFTYTPQSDSYGTDQIIITGGDTEEDHQGHCGNNNGDKGHHEKGMMGGHHVEVVTNYIFNITIVQ
jgi:DNA polymerase sigma